MEAERSAAGAVAASVMNSPTGRGDRRNSNAPCKAIRWRTQKPSTGAKPTGSPVDLSTSTDQSVRRASIGM